MSFFSKLFGGSKSEKDVKKIQPFVAEINKHFASYQSLTNDQLRNKTPGISPTDKRSSYCN